MAGLPWLPVSVEPGARGQPSVRAILRVVVTVVLSAVALFLVYSVREPLGWLVLATFLAVAASGPFNFLARHMRRGAAVALVYLGIVLIPIGIALILLPPVIEQGVKLANNLPSYARE
jgi:predicted PurR-regulated permease PerM